MKQRAVKLGWIGRLVDIGEEFDHPTLMKWATPDPIELAAAEKAAADLAAIDAEAKKKADEELALEAATKPNKKG